MPWPPSAPPALRLFQYQVRNIVGVMCRLQGRGKLRHALVTHWRLGAHTHTQIYYVCSAPPCTSIGLAVRHKSCFDSKHILATAINIVHLFLCQWSSPRNEVKSHQTWTSQSLHRRTGWQQIEELCTIQQPQCICPKQISVIARVWKLY